MPEMDGVTFLKQARKRFPDSKRALLTAYADTDAAIAAINESQVDYYLTKPWDPPASASIRRRRPARRLAGASQPGYGGVRIVGSRWMRESQDDARLPRAQPDALSVPRRRAQRGGRSGGGGGRGGRGQRCRSSSCRRWRKAHAPTMARSRRALELQTAPAQPDLRLRHRRRRPGRSGGGGLRRVGRPEDDPDRAEAPGGQAGTSSRIENYLGFPSGLSGRISRAAR